MSETKDELVQRAKLAEQDELLIFMEYCSEGTLSRVCREGLDLGCVRRYTHYLLQAVDYIPDHAIVHRDTKPANIFLGRRNVLKLGDVGCSFRLRDTCTGMGELGSYVGTTNYMAPEVQTNGGLMDEGGNSESSVFVPPTSTTKYIGYGRAVDIEHWDHEFQVIYHLVSGIQPRIPADMQKCHLSHSFLQLCLCIGPRKRPGAKELLQHAFANIMPQAKSAFLSKLILVLLLPPLTIESGPLSVQGIMSVIFVPTGNNFHCGEVDLPVSCSTGTYCVRPDGYAFDFCIPIGVDLNNLEHYRLPGTFNALELSVFALSILLSFLAGLIVAWLGQCCGTHRRPHRFPFMERGPAGLVRRSIRHMTGRLHRPTGPGGVTVDASVFEDVPLERVV